MYKYKRFCEIYDHQLLKTRASKRVKPKMVGSYWTQCHPKPESWFELYLGLSRRKDRVLVGFKLLKSRLRAYGRYKVFQKMCYSYFIYICIPPPLLPINLHPTKLLKMVLLRQSKLKCLHKVDDLIVFEIGRYNQSSL